MRGGLAHTPVRVRTESMPTSPGQSSTSQVASEWNGPLAGTRTSQPTSTFQRTPQSSRHISTVSFTLPASLVPATSSLNAHRHPPAPTSQSSHAAEPHTPIAASHVPVGTSPTHSDDMCNSCMIEAMVQLDLAHVEVMHANQEAVTALVQFL
jgi:hypothetical protein